MRNVPSITYDEKEILRDLSEGHAQALEDIYRQYWEPLFVKSYAVLRDKQACEDIIQEIFIRLWDSRARLDIKVSLKAYLFASCRYSIYRQIRSGTVREEIFEGILERLQASATHADLEYKDMVAQMNLAIDRLPAKCRQVYKLSREEHLSHKEIAEQLNISAKTVENHITRALQEIRSSLAGFVATQVLISFLKD